MCWWGWSPQFEWHVFSLLHIMWISYLTPWKCFPGSTKFYMIHYIQNIWPVVDSMSSHPEAVRWRGTRGGFTHYRRREVKKTLWLVIHVITYGLIMTLCNSAYHKYKCKMRGFISHCSSCKNTVMHSQQCTICRFRYLLDIDVFISCESSCIQIIWSVVYSDYLSMLFTNACKL